jgi:hypothetical protein
MPSETMYKRKLEAMAKEMAKGVKTVGERQQLHRKADCRPFHSVFPRSLTRPSTSRSCSRRQFA